MLDIKFLRQNKEAFLENMKKRNAQADYDFFELKDSEYRQLLGKQEHLRSLQKKNHGQNEEAVKLKEQLHSLSQQTDELEKEIESWLLRQPNFLNDEVPVGTTDEDNKVVFESAIRKKTQNIPHFDLIENLIMKDAAANMSGSRFLVLKNDLAKLHRALVNFMLDHNTENGYSEYTIPYLAKENALYTTGQLPKFAEDAFLTNSNHWLISTGEVSLVNLFSQHCFSEDELPVLSMTYSPCFRKEAGSAGRDTKGMIRLHQFHKVELVSICTPENSEELHQKQLNTACAILEKLELPYRILLICSGDAGFTAQKQYDIEVWMPGLQRYLEIASCSNCGDFQARRGNIKYKKDGKNHFVHTLNGSSLPIERLIAAIVENYYDASKKAIVMPVALRNYLKENSISI
jgi:seryl-tRNA synthetase